MQRAAYTEATFHFLYGPGSGWLFVWTHCQRDDCIMRHCFLYAIWGSHGGEDVLYVQEEPWSSYVYKCMQEVK
jgi:hypothetical protein